MSDLNQQLELLLSCKYNLNDIFTDNNQTKPDELSAFASGYNELIENSIFNLDTNKASGIYLCSSYMLSSKVWNGYEVVQDTVSGFWEKSSTSTSLTALLTSANYPVKLETESYYSGDGLNEYYINTISGDIPDTMTFTTNTSYLLSCSALNTVNYMVYDLPPELQLSNNIISGTASSSYSTTFTIKVVAYNSLTRIQKVACTFNI